MSSRVTRSASKKPEGSAAEAPEVAGGDASAAAAAPAHVEPGCKHHSVFALVHCPTCDDFFACRYCHDLAKNNADSASAHRFEKEANDKVKCLRCKAITSPPAADCQSCHQKFAEYFCEKCKMYDSRPGWQKNYHCDPCGSCRVGLTEDADHGMFHCKNCNGDLPLTARPAPEGSGHICFENSFAKSNCGFCCGSLAESRRNVQLLSCGHSFHSTCIESCLKEQDSGDCLLCRQKTMFPMKNRPSRRDEDNYFA